MPTYFVASDAITPPTIRITGPLLQHLRQSLRLHSGDSLTVTDDRGIRYRTTVTDVTPQQLEGQIVDTQPALPKTVPSLILALALLKGEKMDWAIQKVTELGIERIVPVHAAHSVVKLQPDRVDHQRARWQRIALEAAQQSERWTVPSIEPPTTVPELFPRYAACASKNILVERSTDLSLGMIPLPAGPDESIMITIGPEGGWNQEELLLARGQGYRTISLGSRILRAETAAVAAVSILQSRLGELG
jgi:16S rRNA (uracil1498-N3)-methyltransferase